MKKRTLTLLMALLLLVSLVPMAAMADEVCGCIVPTKAVSIDGTHHQLVCEHGKKFGAPIACDLSSGTCSASAEGCTNVKAADPECEHEYAYAPNGGTHTKYCRLCDTEWKNAVTENCTPGVDGKCIYCEGGKVSEPEETKPEETQPEEAEPEETQPDGCTCGVADGVEAKYIGGGKHEIYCEHGKVVLTTWCAKGEDGACTGCGHKDPEEKPEETQPDNQPDTKPEDKPTTSDKDLDNVPKTGDNGSVIVYTSLTVLALFGAAAYLFSKKRAF